jgi:hypothetical protein
MLLYRSCVILELELWNISNVIRISFMQVTVPLWMMMWSNTLVYSCQWTWKSCQCVCFVLFYCLILWMYFLCALCCLMYIDMFHIQMQLMQRMDQWNEYVCMYVCMYKVMESNARLCAVAVQYNIATQHNLCL